MFLYQAMQAPEEGKEPYGPACRDYFWLVSRLVDSLPDDLIKESFEEPQNCSIDINVLTEKIANSILSRDYLETRHRTVDDDGLIGLLNLLTNLLKHRPPFQTSKAGKELLEQVFEFLFALPSPRLRHVPKCKSPRSRTAAFDLLVELVKACPSNYALLREKLLKQHQPGPNSPYPWDYWPHEDGRSECGYVGKFIFLLIETNFRAIQEIKEINGIFADLGNIGNFTLNMGDFKNMSGRLLIFSELPKLQSQTIIACLSAHHDRKTSELILTIVGIVKVVEQ